MFHLDLKLLRSFAAVAREVSVTRAAEKLNLTQPTVSGQIKELEQELGFLLFHRTTRKISLSEHGERLLPLVRTLLIEAETLRQEAETMQQAAATHFRLGAAMYSMDFAERIDLLDAFARARPDISHVIDNRLQSDQIPDLINHRLDAALLLGIAVPVAPADAARHAQPGFIVNESQFPDCLDRVILRRRRMGLLVPARSELAKMKIVPKAALAGQRVAMLSMEHGELLIRPLTEFFEAHGAEPIAVPEGNALAIERYALRAGICAVGVGWFPVLEGMVHRPIEGLDFHFDFSVVLGAGANKAARRFFDFAKSWRSAQSSLAA